MQERNAIFMEPAGKEERKKSHPVFKWLGYSAGRGGPEF